MCDIKAISRVQEIFSAENMESLQAIEREKNDWKSLSAVLNYR